VDIVFEHPGRETFGASVYVTRKGGTIVTCASTSGYNHEYDNRYLWMSLKRIVGSHFANYREAWEANRLVAKGKIHPTLSKVYSLEDTGQAAYDVHRNLHQGKVGVLALSPQEGLGVRDEEKRAQHIDAINRFRNI
jgi:crotonyl-CoA reductase